MVRILMLLCISKTNKKCVEHRPQATLVDGVDLDEVLFNVRGFPLSQENWREFLENQHADEVCACGLTSFTKKLTFVVELGILDRHSDVYGERTWQEMVASRQGGEAQS